MDKELESVLRCLRNVADQEAAGTDEGDVERYEVWEQLSLVLGRLLG